MIVKEYVKERKEEIKELVSKMEQVPSIAIVQVNEDAGSNAYVKGKLKDAAELGIHADLIKLPLDTSEEELLKNENGKPYFANGPCFNISHSGRYVLMAVSTTEVGVDIEEIKYKDMSSLVRIFNEAEAKMIKEHSDFYYLWCAKESLIKCMGLSVGKVREIPSLPLNGLKTYKGIDYQCQSFIYDKHIVSITREGSEEYKIDINKVVKLPYLMK